MLILLQNGCSIFGIDICVKFIDKFFFSYFIQQIKQFLYNKLKSHNFFSVRLLNRHCTEEQFYFKEINNKYEYVISKVHLLKRKFLDLKLLFFFLKFYVQRRLFKSKYERNFPLYQKQFLN